MKINYSSTKEDFFIFYFSQVFLKKVIHGNRIFNFANVFNVNKEKIRSIEINNENKTKLLKGENLEDFSEYNFIYNFYRQIDQEKTDFIISLLNEKLSKLYIFLERLFGKSDLPEYIDIAFIQSPINGAKTDLDAFTSKVTKDKIFFNFDNNVDLHNVNKINYYVRVLLHELTHTFINHNENFQRIMKEEWIKNYKDTGINVNDYRINTEELLVGSLVFPIKNFGFSFKELGFVEDEDQKKDSIEKNKYRKMSFEFLDNLEKNSSESKLEEELPVFLKNLVEGGMFNL